MFNILVVDDEPNINKLISIILRGAGYNVTSAINSKQALDFISHNPFDLIITDYMMPDMSGEQLTAHLRSFKNETPIIMITARDDSQTMYQSFDVGVDDYLTKPIDNQELLLRVKAVLRRTSAVNERILTIGTLTLNYDTFKLKQEDIEIEFPPKEFYLLYKLASKPDQIFTRAQLLDEIWGYESNSTENTITVHVNRIRTKLAVLPTIDIKAIRGVGYKVTINE